MNETSQNETEMPVDELKIRQEQTRLLYGALPVGVIATLVNSVILVLVQWEVLDHFRLLLWLAFAVVITLGRLVLVFFYKARKADLFDSDRWLLHFNIAAMLAGLVWMLAVVFLFPTQAVVNQVFLAFVIAGMCAGAVSSLSFTLFPIRAFLLLALIPLVMQFMQGGTRISIAMGMMVSIFLLTLWVSSYRIFENTLQNIRLRYEGSLREQALRESEARYRMILDSAPVGIVHFDCSGKIVAVNQTFSEIAGRPLDDIIGFNVLENIDSPAINEEIREALRGGSSHYTGLSSDFMGTQSTPIRVFMRGITTDNDQTIGGVGIFEDITEDQRLNRMKSEFISTVSHELRTPLTSIRGSLGLIIGDMQDELPQPVLSLLQIASRNTDRLLLLINDILDVSRIEAGKLEMKFEPIEVLPFIRQVLEINEAYGFQYSVGYQLLHVEEGLVIQADRNRLMQVFSNLLSNAAKFSRKGGKVDISFYTRDGRVRFEVCDHGQGIPEEFQSRVFEKFAQYDASDTRSAGGTGLGLSITKGIVEQHHGTISFVSKKGEGTTFYVDLPLKA